MENFRTFLNNFIDFFFFGAKLYRKGTCDKPMDGEYHYDENSENKGYTRQEAATKRKLGSFCRGWVMVKITYRRPSCMLIFYPKSNINTITRCKSTTFFGNEDALIEIFSIFAALFCEKKMKIYWICFLLYIVLL